MKRIAVAIALATASVLALAQNTPAGLWRTIDDDGKTEKSLVRIVDNGGVFTGRVEKIADPAKADEKCTECSDDRKDKPILGLIILNDVRQDPDDAGLWDGGHILDPRQGQRLQGAAAAR